MGAVAHLDKVAVLIPRKRAKSEDLMNPGGALRFDISGDIGDCDVDDTDELDISGLLIKL